MNMTPSNHPIVISGSGLWTPENTVTNEELVASYNAYAERYNRLHESDIKNGKIDEKPCLRHVLSKRHRESNQDTSIQKRGFWKSTA
jgi:hypothetical protein